ncbi:MAG: hypothetical protein ACTTIO_05075 [Candidatus Fimenecus sp.]
MKEQVHIMAESTLLKDISNIAEEKNTSKNYVIIEALKQYRDSYYMTNKATILNREILDIIDGQRKLLSTTINNKTNKLLSELAIQSAIQNQILCAELDVNPVQLDEYRKSAIEFLQIQNRILRLDELAE